MHPSEHTKRATSWPAPTHRCATPPGLDLRYHRHVPATTPHFTPDYQEVASLADGTPVRLRWVGPDARELVRAGFDSLSPTSRYLRFFTAKPRLSERELDILTATDGTRHVAIGATTNDDPPTRGLGIARFVRTSDSDTIAEAAVAVVDDWQGRGIGSLLLDRLSRAALERGVDHFRCQILVTNAAIRALIEELVPTASYRRIDEDTVEVDVPLAQSERTEASPTARALWQILSQVASQRLDVRSAARLLKERG